MLVYFGVLRGMRRSAARQAALTWLASNALPDGTQSIGGELDGASTPFPVLTFGPQTLQFNRLPLDADGFPTDVFFNESGVPFNLNAFFSTGQATITGTLRFRNIPVSN